MHISIHLEHNFFKQFCYYEHTKQYKLLLLCILVCSFAVNYVKIRLSITQPYFFRIIIKKHRLSFGFDNKNFKNAKRYFVGTLKHHFGSILFKHISNYKYHLELYIT